MVGSNTELTLILKAKNLASGEVDKLHRSLGRIPGAASKVGSALKTLAKVAAGLALVGIGALIATIGKATKMAADEQTGILRLNAALKANVKGFNGNTKSIEALIAKREDLAFSDDDLRGSLTILIGRYKDVGIAQRRQAVAMDLARLKGISLEAATKLLTKGLDGSKKILQQLGIEVPKGASKMDILHAIMKKTAGQAEAYGKSAKGAQEAFQIATDDLLEDFGTAFLPIMTEVFKFLRTTVIPAIRRAATVVGDWIDAIKRFVDSIANNKAAMKVLRDIAKAIGDAFKEAAGAVLTLIGALGDLVRKLSSNQKFMTGVLTFFRSLASYIAAGADALHQVVIWGLKAIDVLSKLKLPDLSGIPHFAIGTNFVPKTGLAVVHKGEQITAPGRSQQGGNGGGPVTVNVNSVWPPTKAQMRDIVTAIDSELGWRLSIAPPTRAR